MLQNENNNESKQLLVLLLAVVIDLFGFGMILPFLPLWVTKIMNQSPFMFGVVVSSFSLFQFLFAPFWGRLSDRIGRRPVIIIGVGGSVLGYGLLLINALFFITSIELMLVNRAVAGIFTSATLPTSQAYIADTTPPGPVRTKRFAILGAALGFGFAIGPAIGGILTGFGEILIPYIKGYWAPALFATGLSLVNVIAAYFFLPEPKKQEFNAEMKQVSNQPILTRQNPFFQITKAPTILFIMIIFAVVTFAFSNMQTTVVLLGELRFGLDEIGAGVVFLFIGVGLIVTQSVLLQRLAERISDQVLILSGLIALLIAFGGLSTIDSIWVLIFWNIPLAYGMGILIPVTGSLLSKEAPKELQGSILGIYQSLGALMRIFGPLGGAYLFEVNVVFPYYFGMLLLGVSILINVYLVRVIRNGRLESESNLTS
ncbi:MAG: MFS transporter [Promethearchaeota archaeon]